METTNSPTDSTSGTSSSSMAFPTEFSSKFDDKMVENPSPTMALPQTTGNTKLDLSTVVTQQGKISSESSLSPLSKI